MTPSKLLYQAHNCPPVESQKQPKSNRCILCGQPATIHKKGYIKKTFTNRDLFANPTADAVCPACAFVFSNQGFRYKMYFCTADDFTTFKRKELSQYLFNPPNQAFICAIPKSYHKHLWLHCQVNCQKTYYMLRLENMNVWVDTNKHKIWLRNIEIMYSTFSKTEIETGEYYPNRIMDFGLSNFREYGDKINQYRQHTAIFKLLLYSANKKEKLCPKKRENTKSKKKTKNSNPQLSLF